MANQIAVNVYAIDGIPQPTLSGIEIYLPTKGIFIQEYEASNNPNVHSLVTNYPNPNSRSKTQEFQVWETVGDLETAANTDGNSMFAADVYAINQSPLKNGGKSFLFPNEKPSIWPYSDGFINSLVTFKGNDYYANDTQEALAEAANEGGGGGSSYLVWDAAYQNSAMSSPVGAYLYKDGDGVIWKVYEPVRNNVVSRSQYAYADSIDLFAFDNVNNYDNILSDVKFIDIPVATKFQGCVLSTMVIDANSATGLEFINHNHKGNYGVAVENAQAMPHDAEIYITGNNVLFKNNTCQSGCWIDSLGDGCVINGNTLEASTWIKAFGATNMLIDRSSFGAFGYILQSMVVDNLIVRNCQIDADGGFEVQDDDVTLNYCIFESNCYPVFKFSSTGSNYRNSCVINIFGGFANGCEFGVNTSYTTVGDLNNLTYIAIANTTYLLGVTGTDATLTPV